ncbi:MAG: EpsI family protein [Desulfuromonadaceae bacterium GWC2_58_13]|nr:MAG: EpsI family protein [Desulfuromonadaceae bacterium GWC2_58_13]
MKPYRFYVVFGLLVLTALFVHFHRDVQVPVARPLTDIPERLSGWAKVDETRFSEAVLKLLRPTDYLYRVYVNDQSHPVSLYLGYHGGGPESGPIHSPKHCLPGSGWQNISEKNITFEVGEDRIHLVEAVYQNGDARELFLYWFQVKGESMTSEYALKFAEIKNSVLFNRRDSAFIRISVPYRQGDDGVLALGERFVRDFYPQIKAVLPQ